MVGCSHRPVIVGDPSLALALMVEVPSPSRKGAEEEGVMPLFAAAMARLTFSMSKVGVRALLSLRSNQRVTVKMRSLLQELVVSYTIGLTLLQSTQMPDFSS
jgi:hypothetical protein